MFDTSKLDLKEILRDVHEGKLQLPDFQRDYVWGDEDVRSLIASIAKGFPVGALLTLESGGSVMFKPRLLEGVPSQNVAPKQLLLDGQQRITSLYQVTYSQQPVRTKNIQGHEIKRFYYLDIKRAVENSVSFEECILGLPEDKILRTNFGREVTLDLSKTEGEYQNDYFPLNQVFDSRDWFYGWRDYWREHGRDTSVIERTFVRGILDKIEDYKMPIIKLDKNNSREAICLVFEKVNVGGKKLDAYELVTAIYASDEYDLREDWNGSTHPRRPGRLARMIGTQNKRDLLTKVASTEFLQACTLLHTRELRIAKAHEGFSGKDLPQVSCRRDALLALPLDAYRKHADHVEKGFIEAAMFLNELKIIWHRDISYPSVLVPLASVFAILGARATTVSAKQKLAQWFWSISMGELYGSSTETRIAKDVVELVNWIEGQQPAPVSMGEAIFQANRLRSMRSRNSAAYKALHTLVMKEGCRDFMTGRPTDIMTFFNDKIDIHHIFPISWCERQGIHRKAYNSIINKTALFKDTNIKIGGRAPSAYLKHLETAVGMSPAELDAILTSHFINPVHLRNDDFEAFFEDRKQKLAGIISIAMGKPVFQGSGVNEPVLDSDELDDENESSGEES